MAYLPLDDIAHKKYSKKDTNSGINENQQVAANKRGYVEFEQPTVSDVHKGFEQHSGKSRQPSDDDTKHQQEDPVAQMTHPPDNKALV